MPEYCDPACVKIIIDTGMGAEAARLYAGVIKGTLGVQPLDWEAPLFYARAVESTVRPAAQAILDMPKTKSQQHDAVMAEIDKQCYRADAFIAWAKEPPADRANRAAAWTETILGWAKFDQLFYTEMAAEIGEKKTKDAKDAKDAKEPKE